ncbi:uncharacterized protein SPPG_07787 [Spizellomyces punctatus DAOM BR117]|uniref:Metal-dependent hydrolase n=1 Tax=Spizellomyces punctatus (strain DAOM BR117) TaxID=645134 RepID=A0A0L0H6V2_SPIPD|nr:uncharacterized protein SPPG_07787 [Spizellomyces punctatus DAOM BR117]KNC96967.1 hypothetical protein SPPG_07787 [Spizellomyces punctatus DAOM BR117]|eukprot:XP_016605007.1 hypothetical protein SPPG_07787 [Spizellomyces punctatus DAOM BR117]
MFTGHIALGLFLYSLYPSLPPEIPLVGSAFIDLINGILLLLSVDRISPAPHLSLGVTLDFIDYDHSLLACIAWGAMYAVMVRTMVNKEHRNTAALLAFGAVVSHWVLDYSVHQKDLAMYPGSTLKFGTELWETHPWSAWSMEAVFSLGLWAATAKNLRLDKSKSLKMACVLGLLHLNIVPPPGVNPMHIMVHRVDTNWLRPIGGIAIFSSFLIATLGMSKVLRQWSTAHNVKEAIAKARVKKTR